MASLLNMSGGSLLDKGLPYDAEIEYLESSGTQYIDTGIPLFSDFEMTIIFQLISNVNNSSIMGSSVQEDGSWRQQMYLLSNFYYSPNWYIVVAYNKVTNAGTISSELLNDYCTVVVCQNKLIMNGVEYSDKNVSPFFAGGNCYLFWGNGSHMYYARQKAIIRVKRFSLKDSVGILVRDMIPVRVGQVGYMYDKVSGQLFGNAGTGSFILGPDV